MSGLFRGQDTFDENISAWDTRRVTTMADMFRDARAFNRPVAWDTSRVTTMAGMFRGAAAFNQLLVLEAWDTGQVAPSDMTGMFDGSGMGTRPRWYNPWYA